MDRIPCELNPDDLRIDVFRNSVETHVRITHLPTGHVGTGNDPEYPLSEQAAKQVAMRELMTKLEPTP